MKNFMIILALSSNFAWAQIRPNIPGGSSSSCGTERCYYSDYRNTSYEAKCNGWDLASQDHMIEGKGNVLTLATGGTMNVWLYDESSCFKITNQTPHPDIAIPVGTQRDWNNFRSEAEGITSSDVCLEDTWTGANSDPYPQIRCSQSKILGSAALLDKKDPKYDENDYTCGNEKEIRYSWQSVQYKERSANAKVYCMERIEYWVSPEPRNCLSCDALLPDDYNSDHIGYGDSLEGKGGDSNPPQTETIPGKNFPDVSPPPTKPPPDSFGPIFEESMGTKNS